MKKIILEVITPIVLSVVVLSLFIWFAASQEARSYSKFCDASVTTWDAVWLDLRIDECN